MKNCYVAINLIQEKLFFAEYNCVVVFNMTKKKLSPLNKKNRNFPILYDIESPFLGLIYH